MEWLKIPAALVLVFLGSFGTAYLGSAWERRRKRNDALNALISLLPGMDCGLCGNDDCRSYARALVDEDADPGLCAPGGAETVAALRGKLGRTAKDDVAAFVRCGGTKEAARELYTFDGGRDCRAAAACFQGSRACTEACLGLGSCVDVCPIGAIRIEDGLAVVRHDLCTGCGKCVSFCPTGVIGLIPRASHWQVACNSRRKPEEKAAYCSKACTACGECARLSASWEFSISDNLAKASPTASTQGPRAKDWRAIAAACPTKAIVDCDGGEESQEEPSPKKPKKEKKGSATSRMDLPIL